MFFLDISRKNVEFVGRDQQVPAHFVQYAKIHLAARADIGLRVSSFIDPPGLQGGESHGAPVHHVFLAPDFVNSEQVICLL